MFKLSNKGLLGLALVLSLAVTGLVYSYLRSAATQVPQATTPVMVAKVDIPPKTIITPGMVQEIKVPAAYVQPGAVQIPQDVVGVTARGQIVAGEQITERQLILANHPADFAGVIPRDKRAVTIAVTEVTGVAGFVKAGDFVDIVATFDQPTVGDNVSQMIMQNILVLAVSHEPEAGVVDSKKDAAKTASPTVTLAVTPDEASRLTLAEEKGKLRLALRPYLPGAEVAITEAVTPTDIVGMHVSPTKSQEHGDTAHPEAPAREKPPEQAPPAKSQPSGGIQMIRGTKIETLPVN